MERTRVILAGTKCLSGVTTWAESLRQQLEGHPRYDVRLLHIGPDQPDGYDMFAGTVEEARLLIHRLAPAVLVPNYVWDLYLAGCDPRISCLAMCHADSIDEYYRPLSWYEALIAQFIAVSPECGARLKDHLPGRAADVTTLPYGIHVPAKLTRDYQTDPLRIMYAGRLTQPQKRVRDFLPLVEKLLRDGTPFVFDLYGDGDELLPLEERMLREFPEAAVQFYGWLSHEKLKTIWAEHDVFVQTSDFEGTSISMLEAMAQGVVPVVTAASSGVTSVIRHGENGFVVPVGDMNALGDVLGELAAQPNTLTAVGRASHQSAQDYSMDRYCERFTDVLDRMSRARRTIDRVQCAGGFGGQHPLYRQQQAINSLQAEIAESESRRPKPKKHRGVLRKLGRRLPWSNGKVVSSAAAREDFQNDSSNGPFMPRIVGSLGKRRAARFAICSTLSAAEWGGSEELWSRTAESLLRQGHAVSVHYPYRHGMPAKFETLAQLGAEKYVRVRKLIGRSIRKHFRRWWPEPDRVEQWLLQARPDLALISMSFHLDNLGMTELCRRHGIPYCLLVQAASPNVFLHGHNWESHRAAFQGATRCYFVSEQNRDLMETNLGLDLSRAEIVDNPFCLDPDSAPAWPPSNSLWKLACVGRIDFQSKGQDILLQVLRRPKWRSRSFQVTFYGSDFGNQRQLEAMIDLYRLKRQVKVGGFVKDIVQVWREHHALVLPSRNEGNALAMIEAMVCGRVPIVTNVGRAAALIDDNVSGFIAGASTVDLLDDALERAWQRREEWPAIGALAAKAIRERHSMQPPEEFASKLLHIVQNDFAKKARRSAALDDHSDWTIAGQTGPMLERTRAAG